MKRHAIPSTLTSAGRVVQTWLPGEAECLRGLSRWREVYQRYHQQHRALVALGLAIASWRHGVALSGPSLLHGPCMCGLAPCRLHRGIEVGG